MKIQFAVVPPGGGETGHQFEADMDVLPAAGDYVFKRDNAEGEDLGYATFIVRRRWFWPLESRVIVEVEVARSSHESAAHTRNCELYEGRGKTPKKLEDSCY